METHVVTIAVEFADGRMPPAFSCELYRGNELECRRLAVMIPGCSHDHRKLASTTVHFGTIVDWEKWISGAQCVGVDHL
jgi:hypothetical protein